jgi:hypothetical protein
MRSISGILILVTILITPFLSLIQPAKALTTLYIDPPLVAPPDFSYLPGDQFAVSIMVNDVIDLKSWGVELRFRGFNTGILNATQAIEGDFLQIGGGTYFAANFEQNTAGVLRLACTILGTGVSGVSGSGWLATVIFNVLGGGESPLDLQNTELKDSQTPSQFIEHTATDGFFKGEAPFAFFLYRPYPSIDGYSPCVNQTVTFDATESYDTSGGNIVSYAWFFDDGNETTVPGPFITHTYSGNLSAARTYVVNLTVTSDDGHDDVYTNPDVAVVVRDATVTRMSVEPSGILKAGTPVFINVTVENFGTGTETFNVTTLYNDVEINTTTIRNLNPIPDPLVPPFYHNKSFIVRWDTTGVPGGNYTLRAVAISYPFDFNMTNNGYVWGNITISPVSMLEYTVLVYGKTFKVVVETDSDVLGFKFDYASKRIALNVSGSTGEFRFANVTIPMTLLNVSAPASWIVQLNSTSEVFAAAFNETHYFVYVDYTFSSSYQVFIIGEKVPIPPQPVLVLSPIRAFVGQTITLNGTLTTDPDGHGIKEYFWWIYTLDPQGHKVDVWNATTTQNTVTVFFNESHNSQGKLLAELKATNNFGLINTTAAQTLEVLWPYDIAVTDIDIVENPVNTGEVMYFNVTVTSNLDVHDDLMRFRVAIYGNDTLLATQPYPPLSPVQINAPAVGETVRVDYSWNTTGLPLGVYTIKATATVVEYGTIVSGLPPDVNTADNTFTYGDFATVEKWDSILSMIASPSFLNFGQETTISGSLMGAQSLPVQTGTTVTIRYKFGTATQWSTAGTVLTTAQGTYLFSWKPSAAGTYEVSAIWDGDSITYGNVSTVQALTVRKAVSALGIGVSSQSVTAGSSITISGQATPGASGATVTISVNKDGAGWTTAGTTTMDEDGNYEFDWTPSEAGTYQVKASWDGNSNTSGAESDLKTVTVAASGLGDIYIYIAAGAVILIAVVAVVFFLRRRK